MKKEIKKYTNKNTIILLPKFDLDIYESLKELCPYIVKIGNVTEEKEIVTILNQSNIKKIYLVGNNDFYRYLLPRLKKEIKVCWIFKNSFANISNFDVRVILNIIFEFIDRNMLFSIGCVNKSMVKVFENAGYNCEYIELKPKLKKQKYIESNDIGILSNDYDPNNNYYNQLASLKLVNYNKCKLRPFMGETYRFCEFFEINYERYENIDDVIKNNFVNLYINFTNTNTELIEKSYRYGIPCLVGNTDFYDDNKYLKENLVLKSDDDVSEIAEKINFVKKNRVKIIEEYNKLKSLK